MQNGVYVPAMSTNMDEWSRRRSHVRVLLPQLPRWYVVEHVSIATSDPAICYERRVKAGMAFIWH